MANQEAMLGRQGKRGYIDMQFVKEEDAQMRARDALRRKEWMDKHKRLVDWPWNGDTGRGREIDAEIEWTMP
jgi:hypothetical protein